MTFSHTLNLRRQGLTILTSEGCNFACRYCHQPHEPLHMSPDVVASIIKFVEHKATAIESLDVSWFGGEPLINLKALLPLAEGLQRVAKENAIALQGFMSTNGFLLSEKLFLTLLDRGISRYQITFDGPKEVHDTYRVSASGGPTFDRLWQNVTALMAVDRDFEIVLRVHVTPITVGQIETFIDTLGDAFPNDGRFKFAVASVSHWGGPHDASIPVFQDAEPVVRSLARRIPAPHLMVDGNEICNAANPAHLVIRPNGNVVKCAHSLDLEQNQLGHLSKDGTFVYKPGTINPWIRGLVSEDKNELACPRDGIEELLPPDRLVRRGFSSASGRGSAMSQDGVHS